MSHRARLRRLEALSRAAAPEPHDACLQLWQARIWAANPRESWGRETTLPLERPTDGSLYPKLECFEGPDAACPRNVWADKCYRRDLHLYSLRDLTAEDLMEYGPEPSPETLARQRRAVAALRERMSAGLPKLEMKLHKMKGQPHD